MTAPSTSSSTSPLIAVLLVTSTSRGENVVFSFPKRPHLLKRYSRIRYYATNDQVRQNNSNSTDQSLDAAADSRRKPRQTSLDTPDRDRDRDRDTSRRERGDQSHGSHGGHGLADRDRDQQEEDDPAEEDYQDGLTDSDQDSASSSTDRGDPSFAAVGDDSSEEEEAVEDGRGGEDHHLQQDSNSRNRRGSGGGGMERSNRFTMSTTTTSDKERERKGRSQTREKSILENNNNNNLRSSKSKSRVRSSSRSRTRGGGQGQGQATSSIGDHLSDVGNNNNNNRNPRKDRRSSPSSTLKSYTDFLGYPTEVLAALLAPRRELSQQKFELIVDDLAFLGHPVCVGEDGVWNEATQEEQDEREDDEEDLESEIESRIDDRGRAREMRNPPPTATTAASQTEDEKKEENIHHPTTSTSHHHVHYDETSELHPHSSKDHHHHQEPKASRSTSKSPSRNPSFNTNQNPSHESTSTSAKRSRSRSKKPSSLTLFHLVLVLSRPSTNPIGSNSAIGSTTSTSLNGPDSISLSSWLQFWYDNVAFKMAAALYAEQCRCDYVRDEAEKLIALRERCSEDGASYSSYMTQALATSSLARSLRDLHTSIARSSGAFVSINDTIDAHLQLPPLIHDPTRMLNALDVQTELDGNDPVFLAGEGRPEFNNQTNDSDGDRDAIGNQQAEEKKKLQKLRKTSNNLLPEQFTFIEYTRTTGPFLLPWKTLLILNDRPNGSPSGNEKKKERKGRRRKREENDEAVAEEIDDDDDDDNEEGEGHEQEDDVHQGEREEDSALPSSGIESWARKFTSLLKPTLSGVPTFAELADLLEWDLYEDVYPMARHLIYYREARVVDVPRINSTYAISPMLDLEDLPQLSDYWSFTFPDLQPLPSLLSALSYSLQPLSSHFQIPPKTATSSAPPTIDSPTSVNRPSNTPTTPQRPQLSSHQYSQSYISHAHVQRQKQQCLDALIWLLRFEVVVPLQVRLRLVATESVKRKARDLKSQRMEKRRVALERKRAREEKRLIKIEKLRAKALKRVGKESEGKRLENQEESIKKQEVESPEENQRGRVRSRSRSNPPPTTPSTTDSEVIRRKRSVSGFSKDPITGLMSATRPSTATKSRPSSSHNSSRPSQTSPIARHQHLTRLSPETKKVESLRFERRPISRSRSPSTLLETSALTSLTSTTTTSPNPASIGGGAVSSNGSAGARAGSASGSRPGTPRGRILPINTSTNIGNRDGSVGSVEVIGAGNNSLPNSAGWSRRGRKSRSPSRARMRVKGFGQDEEVIVDDVDDVSKETLAREEIKKERSTSTSTTGERIHQGLGLTLDPTLNQQTAAQVVDQSSSSSKEALQGAIDTEVDLVDDEDDTFEISDFSLSEDEIDDDDDFEDEDLEAMDQGTESWDFEPSLISEPSRADREESEWIVAMLDGKEEWITQRFLRLLPYLNGKHTVDEIVYREELRRRELRAILSQLSEEIITFVHP